MRSATVRGDVEGDVLYFEAATDDELFAAMGERFRGRWENTHHSLYDFLEDRGLTLR